MTTISTPLCLSQSEEYALRAMAFLASQPGDVLVPSQTIAEHTHIPAPYLAKLLRKLVRAKLLNASKGRYGGFQLALPPEHIRFLNVLLATNFRPNASRCAFGWPRCNPDHPCPLHPAFTELNRAFLQWATQTTLSELLPLAPQGAGPDEGEG